MMGIRTGLRLAAVVLGLAIANPAPVSAETTGTAVAPFCDRTCLTGLMDRYLAALVAHDPSGLPINPDARFTENTAALTIGKDGLWRSASALPGAFRIYSADEADGQVALIAVMPQWGTPALVSIRLKLVNGEITEAEHLLTTNPLRPAALANLESPRPEFASDIPPAERSNRQTLVNIADSYFESIEHADGKLAPFGDHCVRHENGMQTTLNSPPVPWPVPLGSKEADAAMKYFGTLNCDAQMDTHVMDYIGRLWPRRHEVVDLQKGLVFSFPMFQHPGMTAPVKVVGIPGVDSMPLGRNSSNMQAGEVFKIVDGKIASVEAMGVFLPYGTRSGWDQ